MEIETSINQCNSINFFVIVALFAALGVCIADSTQLE